MENLQVNLQMGILLSGQMKQEYQLRKLSKKTNLFWLVLAWVLGYL